MSNPPEIGIKPAPFEGNHSKSKEFQLHIRLFLRANPVRYKDAMAQISLFLDLCQGPIAGQWATQHIEEILKDDDLVAATPSHGPRYANLTALQDRFNLDFSPLNDSKDVSHAIQTLQMGTCLVVDYITEFESYAPRTGYNNVALIDWFLHGLNNALRDDCQCSYPMPTTLDEWKARAHDWNAAFLMRTRFQSPRPVTGCTPVSAHSPQSTSASRPRTVAAAGAPLPKLSESDHKCLRCKDSCFRCRQKGHGSRDCPNCTDSNSHAPIPCVRVLETSSAPGVAPEDAAATLTVPAINKSIADLSSQLKDLSEEEREEAKAVLKDMVEGF